MTDAIAERLETLEETVETLCRPLSDLRAAERLIAMERLAYRTQLRVDALESRVSELEQRIAEVKQEAGNALTIAQDVVNSRIWQTLVKASSLLARAR